MPTGTIADEIHTIAAPHVRALARLQLFAEVARTGYEHALLASKTHPDKKLSHQLADYVLDQDGEFYDLYQAVVVRTWAALEAFVCDACVLSIQRLDWKSPPAKWPPIRVDAIEVVRLAGTELAEYLFVKLEDQVKSPLKAGVGRFESVLDAVGLGGPVAESVRRVIMRMSAYRNCIVHSNAEIDRQLVERLPEFGSGIGSKLGVTTKDARSALYATLWYILEVERRVRTREGIETSALVAEQARYEEKLNNDPTPLNAIPFAKPNLTFAKGVPVGSQILVVAPSESAAGEGGAKRTPPPHPARTDSERGG